MTHAPTTDTRRWTIWLAGLVVALGAGVTTAHGLYEVAAAAGTPAAIAWLYPLITDGLALVAYATTIRLTGPGRRYAWTVVVLAAGLSGLAQATYLAGGVTSAGTSLRFGVGAWPAVAAAIAAHLLFLIGTARPPGVVQDDQSPRVQDCPELNVLGVQPAAVQTVRPHNGRTVQPTLVRGVQGGRRQASNGHVVRDAPNGSPKDRALGVARSHIQAAGVLPSSRELANLAAVSRGTAASALQQLRQAPPSSAANSESSAES